MENEKSAIVEKFLNIMETVIKKGDTYEIQFDGCKRYFCSTYRDKRIKFQVELDSDPKVIAAQMELGYFCQVMVNDCIVYKAHCLGDDKLQVARVLIELEKRVSKRVKELESENTKWFHLHFID